MKLFFFSADIHAREWVTSAVCLYMIDQLTYNRDAHLDIVTGLDWYFHVPANPDGYVYTWTDVRLWRKTRYVGEE